MLVSRKDVERFKSIIRDLQEERIERHIAPACLLAFFVENPHLLMTEKFDEHMQQPVNGRSAEHVVNSICNHTNVEFLKFKLPLLEFRTPAGRWASLLSLPLLGHEYDEEFYSEEFLFSFGTREAIRQFSSKYSDESVPKDDVLEELESIATTLSQRAFALSLDAFIADLESRVLGPRDKTSVLWTPKLWTPQEQDRQRMLLAATLEPHFAKWKSSGIYFDDLNPSEFEDLVGELLFNAGLKIYKVRNVPQGGRDLIARGILIPDEEPMEMAIEVKHRAIVDRPLVELALHQNRMYPALLFVTSGRFTAGVFEEKAKEENRFRLFLKDGVAIGDLARRYFRLPEKTHRILLSSSTTP